MYSESWSLCAAQQALIRCGNLERKVKRLTHSCCLLGAAVGLLGWVLCDLCKQSAKDGRVKEKD